MNVSAKTVKAGHAAHPRETKSRALKAVIAPNPMLLSAAPRPGTQTTATTFMRPAGARTADGTPRSGTMQSNVTSGSSIVMSANALKP